MISSSRLIVGLEIHVELSTRSKMFTRVANPAAAEAARSAGRDRSHSDEHPDETGDDAEGVPNTLIDAVVLGLPGALPVLNREAIRLSALVGLALNCRIAEVTKWDRKSYWYPDLPKNFQTSQYDLPVCFDGAVDVPAITPDGEPRRIGIIRAHLEEDAGKLLHEWPGGGPGGKIDYSIADYNRAGTPLLEIVTAPDFTSADEVVAFAQMLRNTCRFLRATEGVMQKGHMRFEPNINMELTLDDGRSVRTPIVEVKNLNSFKSLRAAVEFEAREQPRRWLEDGKEMGRGAKSTRGWDDKRLETFLQREKEDAHDYRYFPEPDLPPVRLTRAWVEELRSALPELPQDRARRYERDYALKDKESRALVEEREVCEFYESAIVSACEAGVPASAAGRACANFVLQNGQKRANERGVFVHQLGIQPDEIAAIVALREAGDINSNAADELFGVLCGEGGADGGATAPLISRGPTAVRALAESRGLIQVRDTGAMQGWCRAVLDNPANEKAVADVRAGKDAAIGRLVGEAMKQAAGKGDAKVLREMLIAIIRA
ncbi:MAG: Asp-tRNA(Asn)/Glu-tRNA(Gln) amidotransferase subunit GatB [Phycisphaerales bacterium]